MEQVLLEMRGITKHFPGVKALDKVDLTLHCGEILALLGENGAGKSTLLKVLSGVYIPDEGEIYLEGKKCAFSKPMDGYRAGISIIHQELNYLDDLTIAENIFLGRLPKKRGLVDWKRVEREARAALETVGFSTNPDRLMKHLTVAEKQLVEIAKAVSRNMKVLVLDEPTSALNDEEVSSLLNLVKKIAAQGVGLVYISHRLPEIFAIAHNVEILRDGQSVAFLDAASVTEDVLIQKMVGREMNALYPKRAIAHGETALEVRDLSSARVHDISFQVRTGEILGIFGLMGAGRTAMAEAVFGREPITGGAILVNGTQLKIKTPNDAKRAGIGYVPAERKSEGLILSHSVEKNISLATIAQLKRHGMIDNQVERQNAKQWIARFQIKTPTAATVVNHLSGGNQQKVVLAKWLQTTPKILILNEPTRGIDVGAKSEIYALMEDLCEQGMAIVMISSELPEILALCDRVCVMAEGTIVGEVDRGEQMTQEVLLKYAINRAGGAAK